MADEKEFVLTREGKLELENELDTLKNITRKEVSEKIKEARSFGDLSENAEYDEAKKEQFFHPDICRNSGHMRFEFPYPGLFPT